MISHQHRVIFALTTAAAVSHHKMCTTALSLSPRWEDYQKLERMKDAELSAICKRGGGFEIPMGEHPEMYTHADYVRLGGKCLALLEDYHQPETEEQREMMLDNVFTDAWFTGFSEHQKRLFYIDMLIFEKVIDKNLLELVRDKDFVELLGGREVFLEHYHDTESFRKLVQLIHSGGYNWSRNLVSHGARLVRDEQDNFDRHHKHMETAMFACKTEDDIDKSYCNIFDMKEVAHIIRRVRDRGGKSALVKLIVDNLYKGDVEISGTTTQTGISTSASKDVFNAGLSVKNGSTSAGFIEFFEDSDNGTNKVTLIGPASSGDVTLTLPAVTDTVAAVGDITALAIALG